MDQLNLEDIKQKVKLVKPEIYPKYKIKKMSVFGSFASGNSNHDSDIDILIEFQSTPGWEFFQLNRYLEKLFNRKVDLVTKEALKPLIKDKILSQLIEI